MGLDCRCRNGYSGRGVSDETSNNPKLISRTFRSLESADTAQSRKSKTHNNHKQSFARTEENAGGQ